MQKNDKKKKENGKSTLAKKRLNLLKLEWIQNMLADSHALLKHIPMFL